MPLRHFPLRLGFTAAALLCVSLLPHTARAQTTALSPGTTLLESSKRVTVPFVAEFPNACNLDMVLFQGTMDVLMVYSENSNGTVTFKQQDKVQGSGFGATGIQYRVFSLNNVEMNGPKPGPGAQVTQTNVYNNDVNGAARDDHFLFQFKTHAVVKDGLPAVAFSDFKTCCPGSQDDTMTCRPVSMTF